MSYRYNGAGPMLDWMGSNPFYSPGSSGTKLSGADWCRRFPDKTYIGDLAEPFRTYVIAFIAAIEAGGGHVHINSARRPPERAYLMHWAWKIHHDGLDPARAGKRNGVDIEWNHGSLLASRAAARDMVRVYKIAYEPSLHSNHVQGLAIDMTITHFIGRKIKKKNGEVVMVTRFEDLFDIGESYGVKKFHKRNKDIPHWSLDGF